MTPATPMPETLAPMGGRSVPVGPCASAVSALQVVPWPAISFVVPLYNHLEHTQAMLISLQASLPAALDFEIVLADDASSDGTRAWLKTLEDSRIKIVLNAHNLGFAGTNNAGVRLAQGEVLGLLNNDLLFEPGWLEPMLDILLSPHLNAGLVGNLQYRVADGQLDHAGVRINPAAQLEHIREEPEANSPYSKALAVTGACMLLRKADYLTHGGFDERYVNGAEDVDLCFKLREAGKVIYVAHGSRIRHHVSLSRAVQSRNDERNSQKLFGRWRPTLKNALSAVWAPLLQSGPSAYASFVKGELLSSFVATLRVAARVIAEAMLLREEYRWARDLGEADPNGEIANRCTVHGLTPVPSLGGWMLSGKVVFTFANLPSARNFYLCGRAVDDLSQRPLAITIRVNGIQEQSFALRSGQNFNVGIIDPLFLQSPTNCVEVEIHDVDALGRRNREAGAALMMNHLVVDEQVIGDLG